MRLFHVNRTLLSCVAGFCLLSSMASARSQSNSAKETKSPLCLSDDTGCGSEVDRVAVVGQIRVLPHFCGSSSLVLQATFIAVN